ncbi:MAG TPA: hypothetical protein DEQ48_00415 [Helicobacter sp.]|nr:hypothetical protein [Helicobacter sp.]
MSSGIPLDELVSVTSAGVREAFSLSKLPTLAITQSPTLPCKQWHKFYDSVSVGKTLGINTDIKRFADNYFSFTSKKAQKADLLNVLYYNTEATSATLLGGIAPNLEVLKGLKGSFALTMGGNKRDVSVDFSLANSFTDCATKLQEAIQLAGAPSPTTLTITKAENTSLEVQKGTDNQATQTLTINTSATDFTFTNSDDSKATFDKATKTITAKAVGETKLTIIAQEQGKNKVRIFVTINVRDESGLKITTQVGNVELLEQVFKVETNADDYSVEVGSEHISYDKETNTLKGVSQGEGGLTFKAKFGEAAEISKVFNVSVSQSLALENVTEAPQGRKARAGGGVNPSVTDFINAKVTFDTQTQGFIIKSGVTGAISSISFATSPSAETDISSQMGLTENEGASIIGGLNAINSFDDLLALIEAENGAYYALQFDRDLSDDETLALCKFVNNSNDRYLAIINTQDKKIITQEEALALYQGYNGVMFEYTKDKSPLGLSAGIISALNFSQNGGNTNIAFNDVSSFENIAITDKVQYKTLEANNANSILKFAQIGQSQVWYGMGNIQGAKTNNANVYVCNSYLKFQLQFALANMLNSQGMVGLRGSANESVIMAYLQDVFVGGVNAGIIVEGATLTTTEKQVLLSTFKAGDSAIQACEKQGYYFTIDSVDLVNSTINISTAYVANKPVKKLVINNYILGA